MKTSPLSINLWFNGNAEEAVAFYTSIFSDASTGRITRAGDKIIAIGFQLNGQSFVALNGGPQYSFSEAISFIINGETQAEIDYYWEKLSEDADPNAQQCGWLKDKFGISWQIVPSQLGEMLGSSDPQQSQRVLNALMSMKKLDIAQLEAAANV
ncbi:MAG TPA: hypothetical protein DCR35_09690 [Runella sp.]|nr:hypothetical protein [Runella sp.]HAO49540.1 hypothetical protein [Runella sp.]